MKKFKQIATLLTVFVLAATVFLGSAPKMNAAAKEADVDQELYDIGTGSVQCIPIESDSAVNDLSISSTPQSNNKTIEKTIYPYISLSGNKASKTHIFFFYGKNTNKPGKRIRLLKYPSDICNARVIRAGKNGYYAVEVTFKKCKNMTFTCKAGNYTYKTTLKPINRDLKTTNALKTFKIGRKQLKGLSKSMFFSGGSVSGKLSLVPQKGWSITSIYKFEYGGTTAKNKAVKNNTTIKIKMNEALEINMYNSKTGASFSYYYIAR